ncbi:hypothetical protein D1872_207770 [compost metagenome]
MEPLSVEPLSVEPLSVERLSPGRLFLLLVFLFLHMQKAKSKKITVEILHFSVLTCFISPLLQFSFSY